MSSRIESLQAKPFTLCMSSGFFGFFAHGGMLEALLEVGLRPAKVCGSSAGALTAAAYASGLSLADYKPLLARIRREDFWDPSVGPGVLRGEKFGQILQDAFPTSTFEACVVPFSCSVYNVRSKATEVMSSGNLIPAVRASCAFPILFQPVKIGTERYLDGGILDRPGFECLSPSDNVVFHHLATRSPWRIGKGPRPAPEREGALIINLDQFTRLNPWAMEKGPEVWEDARERTLRWLEA